MNLHSRLARLEQVAQSRRRDDRLVRSSIWDTSRNASSIVRIPWVSRSVAWRNLSQVCINHPDPPSEQVGFFPALPGSAKAANGRCTRPGVRRGLLVSRSKEGTDG